MTTKPNRMETSPIVGVVYAARLYGSGEYRYVGITSNTAEFRRRQHLKAARAGKKTPFYDWLRKMDSEEDVYFQPVELVGNATLEALGEAERRWIAKLRRKGHRLLNLTEGGLGPRGYVWTDEQRRAAGDRSRGRKKANVPTGVDHPSWGENTPTTSRRTGPKPVRARTPAPQIRTSASSAPSIRASGAV